MARKPISVSVLAGAAFSVLLIACGGASTDEGGVTGLHVALAVPHNAKAEVSGVHFEVTNNLGEARHAIFSLEEEPLPGLLGPDLAGQPFTDWFVRLEPGDYIVAATPLKKGGSPSDLFAQARGGASVFSGMTTALVLTGRPARGTN
ncbi:MAG: hypothetical protein OER77_00155 [Myxococcales bacterium]|nr:hypothetical protein [Myxococcales bacterium]